MSNNSLISWLDFATAKTYLYLGGLLMIGGVIGGLLNIIVFQSLEIYRKSSSAFYLTIVSIINIGQLLTGLFSRVLNGIIDQDWSESSLPICKIRYYCFHVCAVISPTCLCLVTIDQFLATSTRPQWQRLSNIKIAYRLSLLTIIFWLLYAIPLALYYTPKLSLETGLSTCMISHPIYIQYYNNFHLPIFMCVLPMSITSIFGFLAYYNIKQFSYRTVPLIRRRHEAQLTTMVLIQIIFNTFATTPSLLIRSVLVHLNLDSIPIVAAQMRFVVAIFTCIYFLYYSVRI